MNGFDGEESYVFEYEFDFLSEDGYSFYHTFPDGFEALPSDVVLVYLLWGSDDSGNDIWRLLPQSQMMEFGWLQYNYDFTQNDFSIFMEADFPLGNLGPNFTNDWVARVVVVPGQFLSGGRLKSTVDYSDYNAVKEAFDLPDKPLPEGYTIQKRF